ncbi:endonuclease/exonuclease/phosphatase family protein [Conexibacter stalactiti]|uniref:Endonuclease/exonuclease/phosphatase family protein n=1 Tax=Conexibacter stalactiti TaxID=1940611 RepID=A0ABU4HMA7_9ACTN|nr:endonuclease/exonuclease/phosphatase family protein [Conexibacter stalactiti]MDW5594445.1 endonuclease/exonuclease/phosphatase family protein [Conexibacter stalactiti]MEC5035087.1 endonuclease/exonuclease/phosphatase family protein [Conexibacter stalactiti]
MALRVVTWNLFHGRSVPPRDHDLMHAFSERLSTWSWEVALLQEVPPWWGPPLALACDAEQRTALTSRNQLLPLRRAVARRRPELLKSGGGGANVILVRGARVDAHARRRLCLWPERRVVHGVRDEHGRWFANLHATVHDDPRARREIATAAATALRWAGGAPLVFGGDLNVRDPEAGGLTHVGGSGVDHVFAANGLARACGSGRELLDRGDLSDHAPVRVTLG